MKRMNMLYRVALAAVVLSSTTQAMKEDKAEIFKAIEAQDAVKIAKEARKLTSIPFFEGLTPLHSVFSLDLKDKLFLCAASLVSNLSSQELQQKMLFTHVSSQHKNKYWRGLTPLQLYATAHNKSFNALDADEELKNFFTLLGEELILQMLIQAAGDGNYKWSSLLHFFVDKKKESNINELHKPFLRSIENFFENDTVKYTKFMVQLFSQKIEGGTCKGLTPLHYSLQKGVGFKRLLRMIEDDNLFLFYDVFKTPLSTDVDQSIRGLTLIHHAFLKNEFSWFNRFFMNRHTRVSMFALMLVPTSVDAGEIAGLPLLHYALRLPQPDKHVPALFNLLNSDEKIVIFETLTTKDASAHAGFPLLQYALTLENADLLVSLLLNELGKKQIERILLQTNSEAGTEAGLLPIHVALRYAKNPEKVIEAILNEIPQSQEGLREKLLLAPTTSEAGDNQGLTPLHYALTSKNPGQEVKALLNNVTSDLRKKMFLATGTTGKSQGKTVLQFAEGLSDLPSELIDILEQQKNLFILENVLEALKKKLIILLESVRKLQK